ncbi:MAG: 50S ribosomal protein L15 [Clostridia bacterium]|nr:50S ribosomal protein L15 [Clostridia bacterium]MCR5690430.1 50S ribosomal protein L15 [Clostridiales bacterium]
MKLNELAPAAGSNKAVKRVGRGPASGQGKTAGKGHKGQKARAGRGPHVGFEGGQMPLQRRLPKRGFNNIFAKTVAIVNLGDIDARFEDGDTVDIAALEEKGLVNGGFDAVKVLARGEITKKLAVKVNAYSESAKQKIAEAGGTAEEI